MSTEYADFLTNFSDIGIKLLGEGSFSAFKATENCAFLRSFDLTGGIYLVFP